MITTCIGYLENIEKVFEAKRNVEKAQLSILNKIFFDKLVLWVQRIPKHTAINNCCLTVVQSSSEAIHC